MPSGLILGIETSCDETAAAVVRDGTDTLSSVVSSQIDLHARFGGVVPELASREHLRNIVPVVREAVARAGITLADLDAVAVTSGPGLAGALLVGITYAKSLAFALGKPLLAVNHLEGHIFAVLMQHSTSLLPATSPGASADHDRETIGTGCGQVGDTSGGPISSSNVVPSISADSGKALAGSVRPLIALVVSGGHTHLYRADRLPGSGALSYVALGRTVDDAAGEAFDKVAKLLGLPYPGGPWIDALAPLGNPSAIPFRFAPIKHRISGASPRRPLSEAHSGKAGRSVSKSGAPTLDFSFSGIKTAVLRYLQNNHLLPAADLRRVAIPHTARPTPDLVDSLRAAGHLPPDLLDLAASFQHAVVGRLLQQTFRAVDQTRAGAVLVTGGVAANAELRRRFIAEAARRDLPIAFPTLALSTDNAAMIAAAAWPQLLAGRYASEDLSASPQLRLETVAAP